ncbi:MAG: SLBB domain-containing protein [Bacteroidaceae bacterium]|nr:SLBB domain-containing protein [Bacteroidaceae bacterium]
MESIGHLITKLYMKRTSLLFSLVMCLCSFPTGAFGQSMSDDQVIKFVTDRQQAGDDQAAIISKLLQRGVTIQQIQKIRKKYEAEQEQLGAIDITGKSKGVTKTRKRTQKQMDGEDLQMRDNYMLRSTVRGSKGMDNYSPNDKSRLMGDEMGFLDIDSLLYYKDMFKEETQVFGRNIFNNPRLTFEPNMNMATPGNYRLGAGDNVIIDIWGASQETFEGEISPDGTVTIDGVGPISLNGMTVAQANAALKNRLGNIYADSQIQMTLGSTRTIQVQVMGEVTAPGTYTLSALSSSFNALYMAGGISDIGTLRDIKVYRNGKEVASIDVYDYILNGNIKGDIRLQDNDIIVVGPYDALVRIDGKVKRPMFYEMKNGESLKTILSYSGGFAGDAYRKSVRVIRKGGNGSEYSIHTVGEFETGTFSLQDADSIYVDSVIARFSNMAEIRGAVFHPGMYEIGNDISSVRELVEASDGVVEGAFLNRAVMHRQKDDLSLEVVSVNLKGILDGTSPDIMLKKNDVLFVPSKTDQLTEQTLKISGEVIYPGIYQYASNTTLEDLVLQAGGLTNEASTAKVDVFRRIYDSSALVSSDTISRTYSFALKDGFVTDGEQGFTLMPFDEIVVRKSPSSSELQSVTITGSVNFSGSYTMTSKNYKLSDLVEAAGGLTDLAYAKGARLERTMTEEERKQREISLRSQQIALYESSLSADKSFDLNRADSLLSMKLDVGNTYPVAINLEEAMKNPGGNEDIALREYDRLIVPQYSSTVKISGEVMYPISMNYREGESLSYYIKRAGGYANKARKSRVYAIYMNGSVELINKRSSKAIQPGCEIVVPTKDNKEKISTTEWMSMGTTAASISTMMVSIANLLK